MAVNKVIYGGVTLLDLTKDTVTAEKLLKGETAHGKDGSPIVGTLEVGGGGSAASASQNDVTFYDYDGTIVASYSLAEAQELTALPEGPAHPGLTFQGWNRSLEKVKALTRPMNIGAMYITDDGKTKLNIRVWDKARSNVPLYFSQTVANGVTIDWGDGSPAEILTGTGNVNAAHQYAAAGDYTISLAVAEGCTLGLGWNDSSYCVMGSTGDNGKVYCNLLQSAHIGERVSSIGNSAFQNCYSLASITIPDGVTSIGGSAFYNCNSLASITIPDGVTSIGGSAFYNCYSLASITIPDGVTSIGDYAFQYCSSLASITIPDGVTRIGNYAFRDCCSLASITIPDGVTSIGNSAFRNCYSLASITIPDGVTRIGNYAFYYCYSLAIITIPDSVTSIGSNAFQYCSGIAEYHLKPATPPTLSNTNAFTGIPADCIIYVPQGCLEAYQAATNWAAYADYMREEAA